MARTGCARARRTYAAAAVNLRDLHRARGREREPRRCCATPSRRSIGRRHPPRARALAGPPETSAGGARGARRGGTPGTDDPRFAYVYGVALHDNGKSVEATKTLERRWRGTPTTARSCSRSRATSVRRATSPGRAAREASRAAGTGQRRARAIRAGARCRSSAASALTTPAWPQAAGSRGPTLRQRARPRPPGTA